MPISASEPAMATVVTVETVDVVTVEIMRVFSLAVDKSGYLILLVGNERPVEITIP